MPNYANIRASDTYSVVRTDSILEDNKAAFTLNGIPAGASVVIVGGSVVSDYSANCYPSSVASSPSHGGGWTINERQPASGVQPSSWVVYAENLAGGDYTVTVTMNQGVEGTPSNRVSAVAFIVLDCLTSSGVVIYEGVDTSNGSSSSLTTGTLAQTHNLLIGVATGAFGDPSNPTGWTQYLDQPNGGTKVGTLIATKATDATTAVAFTVPHDTISDGRSRQLTIVCIKAKEASTRRYRFSFDPQKLNNSHGAHTVQVYRNVDPDTGLAEKFANITATAGGDVICSPAAGGALLTDTVKCLVLGGTGGSVGLRAGVVEDV